MFDWDGTAVPDREADADALRELIERACALGLHLAIVSGTHLQNVDGQLRARPPGPGSLVLALNRGSEIYIVDADGPRLRERRRATPAEEQALSAAAQLAAERLGALGLGTQIVAARLNRRKLDLIPEPEWSDPPKARLPELVAAVTQRLNHAGLRGLRDAVRAAHQAALDVGLEDPRVTSDAKHVEVGLTDKSDSIRWIMEHLWECGVAPEQVLIAGDEMGPLGGLPGSDSLLLSGAAARATACSVGPEPGGVPDGVIRLGGGPARFALLLADQLRRRADGELPVQSHEPSWTVVLDSPPPHAERVHEALLTLADGHLGTRGSALLGGSGREPAVLMAGVYAGAGEESHLLSAPLWNQLAVERAGAGVALRVLDLHSGLVHERLADDGETEAVMFSSLARPCTTVLRARGEVPLQSATTALTQPPRVRCEAGADAELSWMISRRQPALIAAAAASELHRLRAGSRLDRVAFYAGSSTAVGDELTRALAGARVATGLGFDALLDEHRSAWAARWRRADVRIGGDPELQLAVRFGLFHLISSVADTGEAAVGARGLSGHGYRGHVFWDSDVYVLPFLAATHPDAARALLEYRIRRLPTALRAARALGRAGARFPWESGRSGRDVTPRRAPDRHGGWTQITTGELEEHIVADVAWAAACYTEWSGDRRFAEGPGRELILQCARWWASRAQLDDDGRAHIRDVVGPDEYHEHVDDNAYTNVMARWNLRRAAALPADALDSAERRRFLELAQALVDGYDPATGIYEQFSGFHRLEPLLISQLAQQRPVAADMLLGHARTAAAQVLKQADVLMLHYLVPDEVAPGSLAANLDFYEPRTAHGSTLSSGVHAALLARAGRVPEALRMLALTAAIDLRDIGGTTAGGLHLAAMGSVWRALSFGFAGLSPSGGRLRIDPLLPADWDSLELSVRFRSSDVHVLLAGDRATVSANPPIQALGPDGEPLVVGSRPQTFQITTAAERRTR